MRAFALRIILLHLLAASAAAQDAPPQKGTSMKEPSVADILEHRVPDPPPVGTRQLQVGFEIGGPFSYPCFLHHKDGRLVMIGHGQVCYSSDGAKAPLSQEAWSKPEKLSEGIEDAIRLKSGKIGGRAKMKFFISQDEGATWKPQGDIRGWPGGPYFDVMVQTSSGRLLLPVRITGAGHQGMYDVSVAKGTIQGELRLIEGHSHWPEADNAFVFYSDDEGRQWRQSEGTVMVWHQDGFGGMWPCDEPNIIELRNGDLMMYCRTSLGRIYTARSRPWNFKDKDGKAVSLAPGVRFDLPEATELAASYSPCRVRRIPKTGDLLCVWNQVSGDEIRAGYRRGRLSSAISKDDGNTWQHFRTIDRVVLPPAGRVAPDPEPGMARAFKNVGTLPDDFGNVDYPNVGFHEDSVIVTWHRKIVKPRPGDVMGSRLRVLPLSWFYEDEPALDQAVAPKLIFSLEDAGGPKERSVPALYCDERFFVRLSDAARALGHAALPDRLDMVAPVHQTLTYLGYRATYDLTRLKDKTPRLIVTVKPAR